MGFELSSTGRQRMARLPCRLRRSTDLCLLTLLLLLLLFTTSIFSDAFVFDLSPSTTPASSCRPRRPPRQGGLGQLGGYSYRGRGRGLGGRERTTVLFTFRRPPLQGGQLGGYRYRGRGRGIGGREGTTVLFAFPASLVVGPAVSSTASIYMMLLALQFGTQPLLTQKYAGRDTMILKTTYVGVQDLTRFALCSLGLLLSFRPPPTTSASFSSSILAALASYRPSLDCVVPAGLYALQNYCSITAYQSLDGITYNVLNQTKTIFAALWCFALMHQRQSVPQMVALVILVVAALVMEGNNNPFKEEKASNVVFDQEDENNSNTSNTNKNQQNKQRRVGITAILTASMTSGLAGAWTQRCLQGASSSAKHGNSLVFSMELAAVSFLLLVTTSVLKQVLPIQPSSQTTTSESDNDSPLSSSSSSSLLRRLFQGWTIKTWIPVLANASGGILVGLVTKHAGVVPKGFALILGMFFAGLLQNLTQHTPVSFHQWMGGSLAALSLYVHAAFPPLPR